MSERSGLILAGSNGLAFLDATVALRVAQLGPISEVYGLPAPACGIALADGRVVTVVRVGEERASRMAILCEIDGDPIALLGAAVVATGAFGAAPGGVVHDDALVAELDVRAIYGELEAARWASRALRHAKRRADARGDSERPPRPTMHSARDESGGKT